MIFRKKLPREIHHAYSLDFSAGALTGLSLGLTAPFLAVVARKLGAGAGHLAAIICAPYLGSLLSFYWAHMAERYGRKRCVILAGGISKGLFLFALFNLTPLWYAALISLTQFIPAMGDPAYAGIMTQIYPDQARGKAMGYVRIGTSSTTTLASFIGGRLLDALGYRIVYPVAGFLGIMSNVAFGKIRIPEINDKPQPQEFRFKESFEILRQDVTYCRFEKAFFIFGFGNLMAMPIYPMFVVDVLRLSNFEVGLLATIASLLGIGAMYFWGHLIDVKGAFRMMGWVLLLLSLVPLTYGLARNYPVLFIAAVISGISLAGLELLTMNSVIEISKKGNVPKYMGIHTTLMGIRGSIAPFVGTGLAAIVGLRGALFLSFFLIAVGGILVIREFRVHQGLRRT